MVIHPRRRSVHALTLVGRGVLALLLIVTALANVMTAMVARPWQQALFVERFVDLDMPWWGTQGQVVVGVLLLLVARALMRGKRQAWWLAVGLLAYALVSSLFSRSHFNYMPVSLALLGVLLLLAPLFPTRSDPRALLRGYIALGVTVVCLVAQREVHILWPRQIVQEASHIGPPLRVLVLLLLRGLIFLFVGYGVIETLRPVLDAHRLHRDELAHAERVVRRYGQVTLAHFALRADKSFFWSESRQAFLAYRLATGVPVILGDPIGPEEELEPLMLAFLAHCRRQDWPVAIWQASPRLAQSCRQWNLHTYKMGEEAFVDAGTFSTEGKAGAPVRHSVTRAKRDGISIYCWQGEPLPDPILAGMKSISAAWLAEHGTHTQMGFSMGRFPADWSPDLLTVAALNPAGEVQAFLTWTPLYNANGWALDVMRRLKETTPGTMEMLIAESIAWARAHGYTRMSLGLAPLAGLGAGLEVSLEQEHGGKSGRPTHSVSWLERSASFLHQRKLLLGNYTSLYAFKAKFRPVWEPRYLVISDAAALPRIGRALLEVHGYSWLTMLKETWMVCARPLHRMDRHIARHESERAA
ncbi:MAG TPA: phosphatidylglycerol lysyltransferase domain-containing protein [Ktedonobacterales bacterium]